jgi:hypothetical protein
MSDPLVDHEGNTYEAAAITDWLSHKPESPVTRARLVAGQLAPNRALKDAIEAFVRETAAKGLRLPGAGAETAAAAAVAQPPPAETAAAAVAQPPPAELGGFALDVTTVADAPGEDGGVYALVTVSPPAGETPAASDCVCAVDVSGSMGSAALLSGGATANAAEDSGLSILDVVKHALVAIVATLGPDDRFALVAYSSTASEVMALTPMDAAGKQRAQAAVASLRPGGQTNLWAGLLRGVETVRLASPPPEARGARRLGTVMLLTDGLPNIVPPRGHEAMLQKYTAITSFASRSRA